MTKERTWIQGDVFTTTFWGRPEVCLITNTEEGQIFFIRLESIRGLSTIKKDYCAARMEIKLFSKMQKTFIHHSEWHYQWRSDAITGDN
jgi:hypothetical protein